MLFRAWLLCTLASFLSTHKKRVSASTLLWEEDNREPSLTLGGGGGGGGGRGDGEGGGGDDHGLGPRKKPGSINTTAPMFLTCLAWRQQKVSRQCVASTLLYTYVVFSYTCAEGSYVHAHCQRRLRRFQVHRDFRYLVTLYQKERINE